MRARLLLLFAGVLAGCGDDPAGIRDVAVTKERSIPGLSTEVIVLRTELGVPHLYAENVLDLARAQGFVMAQDRYVQIELTRRFGAGILSEILGDLGLSIDYASRNQGLRDIAQRVWDHASPDLRARFEAFAEGINVYVDDVVKKRAPLPEEVELVGGFLGLDDPRLAMKPMTGFDIAAVGAVIVSRLGYEAVDLDLAAIEAEMAGTFTSTTIPLVEERRAGLERDIVRAVAPVIPLSQTEPGVRTTMRGLEIPRGLTLQPMVEQKMLARARASSKKILALLGKGERGEFGSNSWAVSSKGTGGHGALLANDGHLPLTVPSLFYQMCLDPAYFTESGFALCGLFFPGLPLLAVGTNGRVAWGQTYLDADLTDWYREEIRLGADGLPEATYFRGEWKPLQRFDEEYKTPKRSEPTELESVVRPRWSTFDGRRLISFEGDLVEDPTDRTVVSDGEFVIPRDVDGDSKLTAISLDWTALDITQTVEAVDGFARSNSVAEFIEVTRRLIGYGQNIIVADSAGAIAYSGYHGLPCRSDLPKEAGYWKPGASPRSILDGTTYGGFEIPSDEIGRVREDQGCVVPFDVGPRAITPEAGYVVTANHDPLGYSIDGSLADDPHYIGGPWSLGYRADTIDAALAAIASGGTAKVEDMTGLQNNHISPLGLEYGPVLLDSIEHARALMARGATSPDEGRELAIFEELGARAGEVETRIKAWLARGAPAPSGVETFYHQPTEDDRRDAVATMIHAEWLRALVSGVFGDEGIDFAFSVSRADATFRVLHAIVAGRGASGAGAPASQVAETGESAFFDWLPTPEVERSHELILSALRVALDRLASAQGFNTPEMDRWLWGLKHQVRFRPLLEEVAAGNPLAGLIGFKFAITTETLPLAENIPAGDPRERLENFPRGGDFYSVDVAAGGFDGPYTYSHGPVMRMVISLDGGVVSGRNILPGGQSGTVGNPHFADQAAMWLANETVPLRYHPTDVVEGATGAERLKP